MQHATSCCVLLALLTVLLSPAAEARAHIACSAHVSPCHCGLCPRVVDCSKVASAECFCGTAAPGVYAHPSEPAKFWMCSYDTAAHIPYGVEVACPGRLVFDPVVKVCTVPSAVTPAPAKPAPAGKPGSSSAGSKAAVIREVPEPRPVAVDALAAAGASAASSSVKASSSSKP